MRECMKARQRASTRLLNVKLDIPSNCLRFREFPLVVVILKFLAKNWGLNLILKDFLSVKPLLFGILLLDNNLTPIGLGWYTRFENRDTSLTGGIALREENNQKDWKE